MKTSAKVLALAFLLAATPASAQVIIGGGGESGGGGGAPSGPAGGDLTGTYPNPSLATVNSNVGTFGSASNCPTITANAKGLITAISEQACNTGAGDITAVVAGAGLTGGATSGSATLAANALINAQTGTSYTIDATDAAKLVTFSNGSAIAVTVPQATSTFGAGFSFGVQNKGAGTVTLTPTTSTINGGANITVAQNRGCWITSDGTNWQVDSCTALVTSGSGTINSGTSPGIACYSASTTISDCNASAVAVSIGGFNLTSGSATGIDDGMQLQSANVPCIYVNASCKFQVQSTLTQANQSLLDTNSAGWQLTTGAASGTAPTVIPRRASSNTGWGAQAAGNLSGIVAGTEKLRIDANGAHMESGWFGLKVSTVAALPGSPVAGSIAAVSDAAACTYQVTPVVGSGSTFCPVIYNGSAWQAL